MEKPYFSCRDRILNRTILVKYRVRISHVECEIRVLISHLYSFFKNRSILAKCRARISLEETVFLNRTMESIKSSLFRANLAKLYPYVYLISKYLIADATLLDFSESK
jgi:hypothetical protein